MASPTTRQAQTLRIDPQELKDRLTAGERVTILDARNPQAWAASDQKILGAVRMDPNQLQIDPSWPTDQLTVVY